MLKLSHYATLIESAGELPSLPAVINNLYLDFETTSGNKKVSSTNPWKVANCRVHLTCFSWDDNPMIYAVPASVCVEVIRDLFARSKRWVNQNVKYDAHVAYNDLGYDFTGEFVDTLTLAKLVDADLTYRGGYDLTNLAKHFLQRDISPFEIAMTPFLKGAKNKDYGNVPVSVLGPYGCEDVRTVRDLLAELERLLPEETQPVYATEKKLTSTLVRMERRGFAIDLDAVKIGLLRAYKRLADLQEEFKALIGYDFLPTSHPDCEDLFINRFGLPTLYKEKKGNLSPSLTFEANTLEVYAQLPGPHVEVVQRALEYRRLDTAKSLYYEPWLTLHVDGILHSDNNQNVRSGRMSCKQPNNQQFDELARSLVVPRPGHSFVCRDYSQIEYRRIIDYIGNERCIREYNENPDMDFHQRMATQLVINRKPAKTINFSISYGMGKKKTVAKLKLEQSIRELCDNDPVRIEAYAYRCFNRFHEELPELRVHTKMAEMAARTRGYVRNRYGRRLHLPLAFAHVGFNRVCQSDAADLIKERATVLDERAPEYSAALLCLVHDEVLSEVPTELALEWAKESGVVLNQSSVPQRVPIRSDCGISAKNWAHAKEAKDHIADGAIVFKDAA